MAAIGNGNGLKRARFGGTGSLTLSIDRLGTPGVYRAVLFYRNTGIPVLKAYSNDSGSVTIRDLDTTPNIFFIVAFDTVAGGEAPAISDFLVVE